MRGDKVHGGYEDDMVTAYSGAIMSGLDAEITKQDSNNSEKIRPITSGLEAAKGNYRINRGNPEYAVT